MRATCQYQEPTPIRFVYDIWNLVAELNATNNAVINSFVWGLDLGGSLQSAGGVGGLLAITTTNAGTHFVGFDGMGNVAVLVGASGGTATANYEYDPFGNVLRTTGPMALLNPVRFSTKYSDEETSFSYYGYRFYNAAAGRWLSRDPAREKGGKNVFALTRNDLVNRFDLLGLIGSCPNKCGPEGRRRIDQVEVAMTLQGFTPSDEKVWEAGLKNADEMEEITDYIATTSTEVIDVIVDKLIDVGDVEGSLSELKQKFTDVRPWVWTHLTWSLCSKETCWPCFWKKGLDWFQFKPDDTEWVQCKVGMNPTLDAYWGVDDAKKNIPACVLEHGKKIILVE
jgi:RHS repeat-associated protein